MRTSQKRTIYLALWLVGGFYLASSYNACAPANFSASLASKMEEIQSAALILINKDALFTNSDQVEVNLESPQADEVYVTNDPACASGGQWEPMISARSWTLSLKNQETVVYAKFRNRKEGIATSCLHDAIIHDDQKPVIRLQAPSVVTNVNAPVFFFIAGDTLSGLEKTTCQWPGKAAQICDMASSDGNVTEGRYLVNVIAEDRAGNVSDPVVQDLVVDRTPPTVTLLASPSSVSNSTAVNYSFLAQDSLSGVQSVECAWGDGSAFAPCSSPLATVRSEGTHKFRVRAIDKAGNVGVETTHQFQIDLTAPSVNITSGPADLTNSTSATFAFNGSDDGVAITYFECRVDSQAFSACGSPQSYSNLTEGLHKFEVRGRDSVGNMSAPASRGWIIDTTAPAITFIQTPDSPTMQSNADYKYNVTDSGGIAKTECSIDGGAYQACASDAKSYTGLAIGSHTFKIKATDKAGNSKEASHSFLIDQNAPAIQLTRTPASPSGEASFRFEFQANDDQGVAYVECRLDAQAFAPCDSATQHLVSGLTDGSHRFGVRAVDTAGNASPEASHTWSVDVSGPVISYYQNPPAVATIVTQISLGFTATDAGSGLASLECKLNGTVVGCSSGVNVNLGALPAAEYTFIVTAKDALGNTAVDTKTWSIRAAALKTQIAQVRENRKVDILVVVDNSLSMYQEQANMGQRFSSFMSKIRGLDWQIGVITFRRTAAIRTAGLCNSMVLQANTS